MMSPRSCRCFWAILFLWHFGSVALHAQLPIDTLSYHREMGLRYVAEERYPEAYHALRYYLDHVSDSVKNTIPHLEAQKGYRQTLGRLTELGKKCFENAEAVSRKGLADKADSLYLTYMEWCVTPESKVAYPYTAALMQHAMFLQQRGRQMECIELLEQVIAIRRNSTDMTGGHLAEALNLLSAVQHQVGQFDNAITNGTEALTIYRQAFSPKHEYCGTALSNLSSYYISRDMPGDRLKAIEMSEEAVKILPKKKPAYAQALNNLVVYYSLTGDLTKAHENAKTAFKATKKLGQNTVNYASILGNQAIRLASVGNYQQATEYAHEAINIFVANNDTASLNYARLLSNTASFEKNSEHYKEAIDLWQRAAPIFKQIEGTGSSGYLDCMSEISAVHARTGDLEKAADINEQLQNAASDESLKGDSRYAHSLTKRASTMAADGNYQQAIRLADQALSIFRFRQDIADEASTLNELSNYLYHTGRIEEAIDTCQRSLHLYKDIPGHDEDRALALNNLSIYYYSSNRFDEALTTSHEAIASYKKAENYETSFFAKILTNQALYESRQGNLTTALALSLQADSIQRRILGDIHPDNVMLLYNMANYYIRLDSVERAQHFFHQALTMQMQQVRSNFSHLTTRGRELYWGTKSYIFRSAPYMACLMEENDSVRVDAYDALLFTKGLLLNSEVDFRNLLARTASPKLQEKYANLAEIHQEIEAAWRKPTAENRAAIPQLTTQAARLERELVRECKEYGDFTAAMNISYRQLATALDKDAAAIEFFDINTPNDGRIYWALLARHGWAAPRLIRLFSEREVDNLHFNGLALNEALRKPEGIQAIFEDNKIGEHVWGHIVPHLEGVNSVWFSPSGIFYQWGIEYLRYGDGRINDRYALHRVSSTKSLAQRSANNSRRKALNRAAVFGGLAYDASAEELQEAIAGLSDTPYDYLSEFRGSDDADLAMVNTRAVEGFMRELRDTVGPLIGAEIEANLVIGNLMERDIDTKPYLGVFGTEEAFKQLSGKGIQLIHIATHGFSCSEQDIRGQKNAMAYLEVAEDEAAQADNSLCYSGLLMAGANNVLKGHSLPEGMENGILTAREIAGMDLRGLELAVLSACQTGLGEVKEDGVFGLQRGFKKAGANTLLMSLWSIDDEATQLMMTHFYEALAEGQTLREAFHTAQQLLRADPRFASPLFWASFVMLDD